MTWKSYTVVSGAGLLATWLVSTPMIPPERTAVSPPSAVTAPAAIDIQEQAERLHSRVREETVYEAPARNPFRFAARSAPSRPSVEAEPVDPDEPALTPAEPVAPPPPIRLSGVVVVAEDGTPRRSAILITLSGVLQVREGDAVGAEYRVSRIEENAVELVANDGSVRRLTLRP